LTLISKSANDERERARRVSLLGHLQSTDKADALELAKYSLEKAYSVGRTGSIQE